MKHNETNHLGHTGIALFQAELSRACREHVANMSRTCREHVARPFGRLKSEFLSIHSQISSVWTILENSDWLFSFSAKCMQNQLYFDSSHKFKTHSCNETQNRVGRDFCFAHTHTHTHTHTLTPKRSYDRLRERFRRDFRFFQIPSPRILHGRSEICEAYRIRRAHCGLRSVR